MIRAGLAAIHVVRVRRELAALDGVDGVDETLLRLAQHAIAVGRARTAARPASVP